MAGTEKPRPAPSSRVPAAKDALPPKVEPTSDAAKVDIQALMEAALGGAASMLYANGFALGMTNADVFIVLQMFGRPVAVVNVSYTLAKTMALKLNALVADWERQTKQTLQTTDLIDNAFKDKLK